MIQDRFGLKFGLDGSGLAAESPFSSVACCPLGRSRGRMLPLGAKKPRFVVEWDSRTLESRLATEVLESPIEIP